MTRTKRTLPATIATATLLTAGLLVLAACATAVGTAAGAGIGSMTGDTTTGAIIGGTVGALIDIF